MTLGDAKVGSTVVVTKIEGDSAYKRRIMDMGITKGSELYIRLRQVRQRHLLKRSARRSAIWDSRTVV